jgi:O-antigen biosynthesis protein WbqP
VKKLKRTLDIIFSLLFLIIVSPIILILAIAIKIDSKGPAIFKQKRIGKDNRIFYIYKLRSMRIDTPNVATDKLDSSKYITRVGKYLRKTSLDELPQLFNILKGDMSFVGPRPALYNQYELIEMRTQKGIHKVRPGLTGLAQISGRDELSNEEKVYYDEQYVKQMSIILDLKIIIKTFLVVITREGVVEGARK